MENSKQKLIKKKINIKVIIGKIFSFIAGIMGLLALFTPAAYAKISDSGITLLSWNMWMFGFHDYYDYEIGTDTFWTGDIDLLAAQLTITTIVIILNILVLFEATRIRKNRIYEPIFSVISAIGLFIAMIVYIGIFEFWGWIVVDESFWSLLSVGFAIIGQFLASGLMFIGYLIAKSSTKYISVSERSLFKQEQKNTLFKRYIDTYFSKSEKHKWLNKLEVIRLHQKGIAFLEKKVEFLATRKKMSDLLKTIEYEKALDYFHKAVELSAPQPINLSEMDLELAYKIIEEEKDKKKALECLNQIRRDTALLLREVAEHIRYTQF